MAKIQNIEFVNLFSTFFRTAEMDLSSIAVAYYLLLTIFPFLVLLANIFPYININTDQILIFLKNNLPKELYSTTSNIVITTFNKPNNGLVWISVITGLWTMSKSMTFLQKAINKAYGANHHRSFLLRYLLGFVSSILIILFLIVAIILSTFGTALLHLLYRHYHFDLRLYNLLYGLTQPVTAVLFFIVLGILYYISPNVHIGKIRYILPGTIFTTLVLMSTTSLFGFYVTTSMNRFQNLRMFGSVTILAVMLWFNIFAKIIIFGAILNASYQKKKTLMFEKRESHVRDILKN